MKTIQSPDGYTLDDAIRDHNQKWMLAEMAKRDLNLHGAGRITDPESIEIYNAFVTSIKKRSAERSGQ